MWNFSISRGVEFASVSAQPHRGFALRGASPSVVGASACGFRPRHLIEG